MGGTMRWAELRMCRFWAGGISSFPFSRAREYRLLRRLKFFLRGGHFVWRGYSQYWGVAPPLHPPPPTKSFYVADNLINQGQSASTQWVNHQTSAHDVSS